MEKESLLGRALRVAAMALSITAVALTLSNRVQSQNTTFTYSTVDAFRFLVHANSIAAVYNAVLLLLAPCSCAALWHNRTRKMAWVVFITDQVITYVVLAAVACAMEVTYLAYNGDKRVYWEEVCKTLSLESYCWRSRVSVLSSMGALTCLGLQSIHSAYSLFSMYEPP